MQDVSLFPQTALAPSALGPEGGGRNHIRSHRPNHSISTTENIDNMHIIANWTSLGGKVYDTTFVSNRAARVVEKLSREYGLIIANEVCSA